MQGTARREENGAEVLAHKIAPRPNATRREHLAQAAYGAAAAENQEAQRPTMRGFKIANSEAGQ